MHSLHFSTLIILSGKIQLFLRGEINNQVLYLEQGINDKICSMDYKNYKVEIKTADAQDSMKNGVILLVTGYLTGIDNLRRRFTQTFFLAPQDVGYFVLNDVFRYVDENVPVDATTISVSGIPDTPSTSLTLEPGCLHISNSIFETDIPFDGF